MKTPIPDNIQLPQDPVFIVGYPRSGTTLVQTLLATQENIYSLPETHFFTIIHRKAIETDSGGIIKKKCLRNISEKILEKMNLEFTTGEMDHFRNMIKRKQFTPKYLFEYLVARYIPPNPQEMIGNRHYRWVEKTPNHAYVAETILSFYPNAQFINVIRHPLAAVLSRKKSFPFSREKSIEWLASKWRQSIESMEAFSRNHPARAITIRYEDLTAYLEKECNRVSDFIKHPFDFSRLDQYPAELNHLVLPTETWKQKKYREGIKNTNSHYFETASGETIRQIEEQLSDLMKKYRYNISSGESDDKI